MEAPRRKPARVASRGARASATPVEESARPRDAPGDPARPAPALARNALIPLSIVVCFVLFYVAQVPFGWVLAVAAGATALYLLAPAFGRRSAARFDRDLVHLLSSGRRGELRARYRRALGMRLFAAPAVDAERRALVAAECGEPQAAHDAYREALAGYGAGDPPLAVVLGLAHASYALGQDEEAIAQYRAVLGRGALPLVAQRLAHALARHGELAEADRVLERHTPASGAGPDLLLVKALVQAKRGRRKSARALLESIGDGPTALRQEVERALSRRSA